MYFILLYIRQNRTLLYTRAKLYTVQYRCTEPVITISMYRADLSHDDVAAAATSLMVGLEENAFLLADSVTTEKIIIKPTNNIRE